MIQYDFSKSNLSKEDLQKAEPQVLKAKKKLEEEKQSKKVGWWQLPFEKPAFDMPKGDFENFILLGIGGSSQGLKTLADALLPPKQRKRLIVLESSDPRTLAKVLDSVDLKKSLLNVVSKSGGSIETLTLFDFFKHKMDREQMVITTEEGKGTLYKVAQREKLKCLPVPENVGGRFSVFSNVALFPLAFLGVDVAALLSGARKGMENPESAFQNGLVHHLLNRNHGKTISVMMPYADCLNSFGGWYAQLWAESLGKEGQGQTPLVAKGPQDQHSLAQLFMDGPKDKVVTFIKIATDEKEIPFGKLLFKEWNAMAQALYEKKVPSVTLTLPDLKPETLGELLAAYQIQTAFVGHLMGIDPYDQPAVERIKQLIA